MIEVEATAVDGTEDNWFGVICRLNEDNFGYAFVIGSDGFWAITRVDGDNLDFIDQWREHDAINTGINSTNTIQAYCVDDYLGLYINGEFVGDHTDSTYDHAGSVALVGGGPESDAVTIQFDNLSVNLANRRGETVTEEILLNTASATPEALPTLSDLAPPSNDSSDTDDNE